MKAIFLLLLFFPSVITAQNWGSIPQIEDYQIPTNTQPWLKTDSPLYSPPCYNILYVIDGIPFEGDIIAKIEADHIESITTISKANLSQLFCRPLDGIVIIRLKRDVDLHSVEITADGFEQFIAGQPSKEHYAEASLKNKNIFMVKEWNRRYENPTQYGSSYGMRIDYDPKQDYGLDIEYQLYMFFKFMEKENEISLGIK